MRWKWGLTLLFMTLTTACYAQATYTYADLVKRLTDMEALAVLPQPGEKCQQWSSYDRASRLDETSGKYVAWDANGDGGGIIRQEGDQQVLAEMDGPGVLWRIWSAAPGNGHVRIFLDGQEQPVVDLPFKAYFDGKHWPFIFPALAHDASSGKNLYVPIPYSKSCKIIADKDWGLYFHFTYTTYPKGTVLPTFKRQLAPEDMDALYKAEDILTNRLGTDPVGSRPGEASLSRSLSLPAGKTAVVARLSGARAITALRVKMRFADRKDEVQALRDAVLRITFDGETQPSVWVPLGDFFGSAPGINNYRSLPLGMTDEGFYSFWYMPFGRSALVEIINEGKVGRRAEISLTHAPLTRPIETLARFHAKWHRDSFLPTESERKIEWTMLQTEGRGRFVGVMLHIWNPKGDWWGEGDEMFYIDGEKFPSTFGTGSEDYFGYAWCNPARFENAFHNQPFNSGNNRGHACVNRWHITDNIPFDTAFTGTIEKYFPNDRPTLYACTAYWYQAPGGRDPYQPVAVSERTGYFDVNAPEPKKVKGALEGEALKVQEKTGGQVTTQGLGGMGTDWSRDEHMWWTEAKPGDRLTLVLPVKQAGRYALKLQMTKAVDYGIVQISLDGRKLGGPVDLYETKVVPTGEMDMGVIELKAGDHDLQVEIVGANEKAVKKFMFGLDYVKLDPAR